jgi:hypothetical protein
LPEQNAKAVEALNPVAANQCNSNNPSAFACQSSNSSLLIPVVLSLNNNNHNVCACQFSNNKTHAVHSLNSNNRLVFAFRVSFELLSFCRTFLAIFPDFHKIIVTPTLIS